MRQIRKLRHVAICVAAVVLAVVLAAWWAVAAPADPVDDLRQILRRDAPGEPPAALIAFRQEALTKAVDRLKTMGDLRRALALADWDKSLEKAKTAQDLKLPGLKVLADMELAARNKIGERLTAQIEAVVERGDKTSRLAVANMIAEMGPNVRALKRNGVESGGFARALAPLLVKLAGDARDGESKKSVAVRQEALRALGSIYADPKVAVPELERALSDAEVGPRRVAADALVQMIRIVTHLKREERGDAGIKVTDADIVATASAVLAASRSGLRDPDAQVVTLCLDAGRESAIVLHDRILQPERRSKFPLPGWPLAPDERKEIEKAYQGVLDEFSAFEPLLKELDKQGVAMLEVLANLEPARRANGPPLGHFASEQAPARLVAMTAFESIAYLRNRMQRRLESIPIKEARRKDAKDPGGGERDLGALDPLKTVVAERRNIVQITHLLQEPDAQVRRRTVEFLELVEDEAVPAIPALTVHLADPDRFVRWASARALGRIAPAQSSAAVLGLARLLEDSDLNVRKAAAETLEVFGGLSEVIPEQKKAELERALRQAVPYLARAVNASNTEVRIAAMYTLLSFGVEVSQPAAPALAEALNPQVAPDPRVRQVAAEVLGKLGPRALINPATNQIDTSVKDLVFAALRRAIGDEDPIVRSNASDALLSLNPLPKKL